MNITRIEQPGRLGQPWVREIVPGVFRVGTTFSGCYVVEDAGAYTFFAVGLPGYWPQMTRFLAERRVPRGEPYAASSGEHLRQAAGSGRAAHDSGESGDAG